MLFDFNFPTISFVKSKRVENSAIVIPYHVEDDKIVLSKEVEKLVVEFIHNVSKSVGSIFTVHTKENMYVLVNVKKDDIESGLVAGVKAIPDSIKNVYIELQNYDFYDKLMISKILFNLKRDWNLKTKQEIKEAKNIYLFVKDPKKHSIEHGKALAETQAFVQQLVNMPANYLTPHNFGEIVKAYLEQEKLTEFVSCDVHGKDYILEQKMGSFYGVAKGSKEEPKLIVLQYNKAKKDKKPVVLVGKGLTFDSGGISIKPSLGMDAMKGDMAGAATALSAIIYAAKANLPINMVSIAACCENMPSGESVKPGDVLTAMNGTTIEVLDTDAEGRLVLADALLYSQQFNGKYTIDMATLTGACIMALGYVHTGLFTKDDKLAEKLISSGKTMKDVAWQLPLEDAHEEMLESKIADMSNLCIGKGAGAQGGAVFLQRFAPKEGWCHLDIAGSSAAKGGAATSRPLAMISEFLDNQSN